MHMFFMYVPGICTPLFLCNVVCLHYSSTYMYMPSTYVFLPVLNTYMYVPSTYSYSSVMWCICVKQYLCIPMYPVPTLILL